ncbi:MAG: phage holin family protein [Clostridia bacterium]|nr:phage holin family protein [Clostridia bacterium]MBR6783991.1 phage holin family protein [Clostridia bacterium]
MDITSYIEPKLLILIPVLYMLGLMIKKSEINDKYIPLILGVMGIILATVYSLIGNELKGAEKLLSVIFAGVTQGLLCASASVYANNIFKQMKRNGDEASDKGGGEDNI